MTSVKSNPISGKVNQKFLDHLKNDVDHYNGWPKSVFYETVEDKKEQAHEKR
jgi:hypothetical protein